MQDMNNPSTEFSTPPIWVEIKKYFNSISLKEGKSTHWRTRAKLAVRGSSSQVKIGLFKPGTHEVEDLTDCPDHHPSINEALLLLRSSISQLAVVPYDEYTLNGDLRYVQLTVERSSKKVQLALVGNGKEALPKLESLAQLLWKNELCHSIWINLQQGSTNTIFGPTWIHLKGPEFIWETFLTKAICFHPACFIQANPDLFEQILLDIKTELIPDQKIIEFYAGVGVIGLCLADKCQKCTLVEVNPFAENCFRKSSPPSHYSYITGPTQDHINLLFHHDTLLVDPPRKGLDTKILEAIPKTELRQILYLSCNFLSLKSDIETLKKEGWQVSKAQGYALFPHTNHVEILVHLQRS